MANLNNEQIRAVEHLHGPCLVLAGPGSGKTHTLVTRIKYMIENYGISPKEILVITFSKKASIEMKERFEKATGKACYPVYFGTFHAVFYSILKAYYNFDNTSILKEWQKRKYIQRAIKKIGLREQDKAHITELLTNISAYKTCECDEKLKEKLLIQAYDTLEEREEFVKIYEEYGQICKTEKKIDFDDMLYMCKELLTCKPEVLRKYQSIYKYILVDEFQDINQVQYDILVKLAGSNNNVFAVGDDDQSIYGFRGSRPELMQKFINENTDCKVIDMYRNYRCAECVIEAASRLISNNKSRIIKNQLACKADKAIGSVNILACNNAANEAECVANIILEMRSKGVSLDNIAVIYRTSKCVDMLKEKMTISGIPYNENSTGDGFYDNEWVMDIVCYLKASIAYNALPISTGTSALEQTLFRIMNRPDRGLIREEIHQILSDREYEYSANNLTNRHEYNLFFSQIKNLSDMSCFAAVFYILKAMGYEKYMFSKMIKHGHNGEDVDRIIHDMLERAKMYTNIKEWIDYIDSVKQIDDCEDGESEESREEIMTDSISKVNLLTAHASKGLEFETVFIVGLQEGIFPHNKAITEELLEEERRLMYVAMTRAKKDLYIIGRGEEKHGKRVSQFLKEIETILL